MLHKIDSEIGQIRQKIDSLTNIEHDEESYSRKFNGYLIFGEFLLSVIAMMVYMVIWERRRARNYDAIQNNAEMQDNASDMNHNEDNLLIV
ncbi:hypothetical protein Ddc_16597 [Ditylenchus destructor]|nr:hypothetical protein Ddc_16597 [Ditylenchus destructor]